MIDDDFSREQLVTAFRYQLAHRIVGADGSVSPAEKALLDRMFPAATLRSLGFVDHSGSFTQRWHDALGEALVALPSLLSVDERLDLIESLWAAALADDEVHPDEQKAVAHAGRLLGLPLEQIAERLKPLRG
jgi:uncharacterized tellurite resistance protein B-like protein